MEEVSCLMENDGDQNRMERGLTERTKELVEEWLRLDKDPITRAVIERMYGEENEGELNCRLGSRMAFGTAGLRAKMGAGYSMMNDLTIIQTTQGLVSYLLQCFTPLEVQERGVAVGYDARYNSLRFAQLTASIFLNEGFKVYLFSHHVPTPYVAYAVLHFGCVAGVQVTASHNPKEYNGYKVYWDNGAQIIPPHDVGIATEIETQLTPWRRSWSTEVIASSPLVSDPMAAVEEGYYQDIHKYCVRREFNCEPGLRYTFTPMHGVGGNAVVKAFKAFGLPELIPVKEQMNPDPDFPTVQFPNPEEGKSALDLAMRTAEENDSTVILATDPDADRLALAERHPTTRQWKIFSGNETGALLSWWALKIYKDSLASSFDGSKVYMLASTVSSKFIRSFAKEEGFNFEETLTGFKWMGNRTASLQAEGNTVLFAFEEAIGYMFGGTVLDKDGISAAAVLAEYGGWLQSEGKTFHDQLTFLYHRYGYYLTHVSYYICYDQATIQRIFDRLRGNKEYPTQCGQHNVTSVVDLTVGYDSTRPPQYLPVLPVDPRSQLITFTLDNNCVFTLRTSGTEPKVKYYVELYTEPGCKTPETQLRASLSHTVQSIMDEFLQPEKNGLLPRPT